jgi:GntR family transcriptional regulator/MocR family aminotransferase
MDLAPGPFSIFIMVHFRAWRVMPKRSRSQDVSLGVRPRGKASARWMFEELRSAILAGRLAPGTQLPSSREFARQYGLSRGTVVAVFERLGGEGYVSSRIGAGTFVSPGLAAQRRVISHTRSFSATGGNAPRFSRRGQQMRQTCFPLEPISRVGVPFRSYQPDLEAFPFALWSRIAARRQRLARRLLLGIGDPRGYRPLREAVASYLGSAGA